MFHIQSLYVRLCRSFSITVACCCSSCPTRELTKPGICTHYQKKHNKFRIYKKFFYFLYNSLDRTQAIIQFSTLFTCITFKSKTQNNIYQIDQRTMLIASYFKDIWKFTFYTHNKEPTNKGAEIFGFSVNHVYVIRFSFNLGTNYWVIWLRGFEPRIGKFSPGSRLELTLTWNGLFYLHIFGHYAELCQISSTKH